MKTPLRWIARGVFLVALVTWGGMAIRSMNHAESWQQTRRRTAAFIVMFGAGMLSLPTPKRDKDEEESY